MKIYRLTGLGKTQARNPVPDRDEVLDYLYEHKTANYEELCSLAGRDKLASLLRAYVKKGLVEEIV